MSSGAQGSLYGMFDFDKTWNGFAATDLPAIKDFYERVVGLEVREKMDGYILMLEFPDGGETMVYFKPDFQPSNATIFHFAVPDVEAAVDQLTAQGVTFERYEGFEQDEKGIARGEGPENAWFKDPAGNLLAVVSS